MKLEQETNKTAARRRATPAFRKACCSRLHSHPLQSQPLPATERTCLEGPFGELLRATGPMAKSNPFRFSTKYHDDEAGFLYYGYRYYNSSTGRWLSKDPSTEPGFNRFLKSANLSGDIPTAGEARAYLFSANNPNSIFDFLGLADVILYDGGDRGDKDNPLHYFNIKQFIGACKERLCTASAADFRKYASTWQYSIDIRGLSDSPPGNGLIDALKRLKSEKNITIDNLAIIDHGIPAHQEFGDIDLLDTRAGGWGDFWAKLGNLMSADGWIDFHGCNVGANGGAGDGSKYVQRIADLAQRNVSAWTGTTGTSLLYYGRHGEPVVGVPKLP
jgi:RHS repeat-associated protein